MKKIITVALTFIMCANLTWSQEYKVITIVESIVPMGAGRSRIIENQGSINISDITTEREGDQSKSGDVKRSDLKKADDNLKETKLLNFYSLVGINFGNIASNDVIIAAKMNEMTKEGWKVAYITSGVESDGGTGDGSGIFITRIFFSR